MRKSLYTDVDDEFLSQNQIVTVWDKMTSIYDVIDVTIGRHYLSEFLIKSRRNCDFAIQFISILQ